MSDHDPLRDLWAGQQTGEFSIPLEEIRRKARGFQKTIRWRNIREYAASALVIGVFGWMAVIIPEPVVKAGCILTVLGALYVCWKLHTMARAAGAEEMNAAESLADFHRKELLRQRAALASVWRWYLLPFVPGMAVFLLGVSLSPDNPAPLAAKLGVLAFAVFIEAAVFGAIWWLNAQAAKALDKEIAALDD
ncbi:hypothetical protein ACQKH5_04635 [Hyphomonas sp. NPDC076900]|uniref:hypothetical protein n=1 Tax=unclassified Hyphomonas TaxID=2630699 RepID=UPI003D00BB16